MSERVPRVARERKVLDEIKVRCPAGQAIGETAGGSACRCRITHETLDTRHNPSGLSLCLGDFTKCPTWQIKVEAERRGTAKVQQDNFDREAREAGEPV